MTSREALPPPRPKFYWGVGIENCWIAQADPVRDGSRRLLDLYLQMQHYENWKEDLGRAADAGVNAIRYSVPWYRAEPRSGVYDWSLIDEPADYMVNKLGIIPILDIIHYGTPAWMAEGVIDERFPEALAVYAAAMANHFKGLVNHYTPHNEPQATCLFCGLWGRWPPYAKSAESWVKIGIQVAKAMILEMGAIREVLPDAVLISADVSLDKITVDLLPPGERDDPNREDFRMAVAFYPSSLVYGKVNLEHPLVQFLNHHGAEEVDLQWCCAHAKPPDILGFNYYPDLFDFWGEGDFTGNGIVPVDQAACHAVDLLNLAISHAQSWFRLPIYLTETSAGLTDQAKVAYIHALYERVCDLRRHRFPLAGVNWWPLYNTIVWEYREEVDKLLEAFLQPGGWNNGLYVTEAQPDRTLKRIRTPAVDAYREVGRRLLLWNE